MVIGLFTEAIPLSTTSTVTSEKGWRYAFEYHRHIFVLLTLLVNGNHLAADNMFIEKRRRGLVRFANALVRHPVLCQEQLVVMFLTVPTVSDSSNFSDKSWLRPG